MNAPDRITTKAHSPDSPSVDQSDSQSSSSAMIVESSKLLPWLMLCCLMSAFSLATSLFVVLGYQAQMQRTERETRLLSLQVQDQSAIMIREGLKRPEDLANGPTYEPRRK